MSWDTRLAEAERLSGRRTNGSSGGPGADDGRGDLDARMGDDLAERLREEPENDIGNARRFLARTAAR